MYKGLSSKLKMRMQHGRDCIYMSAPPPAWNRTDISFILAPKPFKFEKIRVIIFQNVKNEN